MNNPAELSPKKVVDRIQQRLTDYASNLHYDQLPDEAIHAAKVRIIDVLGAVIAGFFGEPCQITRALAAQMQNSGGATVIGTRMKTTLDMAAFVNGTTARYPELTDSIHSPGSFGGHASDAVAPVISVAEHAQANGRDLITAIVLAYEVYCRIADVFKNRAFHHKNFGTLSSAIAAGKLLALRPIELSHCISMAIVPNVMLHQATVGDATVMFKAVGSGQAARAGVFAAMLAQAGMEGPHLPFEGKAGWCDHVAGGRFSLDTMGGAGTTFKILDTLIKNRSAAGFTIAAILAAEKVASLADLREAKKITVEVNKRAQDGFGTSERFWNPKCREDADHSIPYVVVATLMDGTITPRSYNDSRLFNPVLRGLLPKVEVVENTAFSEVYPKEHRARVIVEMRAGARFIGEAGGDADDMSLPKSDAQIEEKFRGLTEDILGAKKVKFILDRLWSLEDMQNVAEIPTYFVLG